jgi:hypothetical protein
MGAERELISGHEINSAPVDDLQHLLIPENGKQNPLLYYNDFLVSNSRELGTRKGESGGESLLVLENRFRNKCKWLSDYQNSVILKVVGSKVVTSAKEIENETAIIPSHISKAVSALKDYGYIQGHGHVGNPKGKGNQFDLIGLKTATAEDILAARDRLFSILKQEEETTNKSDPSQLVTEYLTGGGVKTVSEFERWLKVIKGMDMHEARRQASKKLKEGWKL